MKFSHNFHFCRLNCSNSFSLSLQEGCSSPLLLILIALFQFHSSCAGAPRAKHSSLRGFHGQNHSLSLGYNCFWAASTHYDLILNSQIPSDCRTALNLYILPDCINIEDYFTQVQDLALGLVELCDFNADPQTERK